MFWSSSTRHRAVVTNITEEYAVCVLCYLQVSSYEPATR
jgi:hypothetical protein